jgi:ubiquinone/menaquinone biosynthesis C-methylase UbiE
MSSEAEQSLVRVNASRQCVSTPWEDAYNRFETPEEEIAKFMKRLRAGGSEAWPKNARVIELFCGRGNGLHALERLAFTELEGADLSESLLAQYAGRAKCYVCDCRELPFKTASREIAIIQGGLHHLPQLPEDLEKSLREIHRILKPGGCLFLIEPWLTPFLAAVHFACGMPLLRRLSVKLDSLATMIDHERETYENWLSRPDEITDLLRGIFPQNELKTSFGKIRFIGRR